ncbi:5-oxoprolinase [Yamadazyma tenuis ATCC 10573]|uniref:5-oxoprolinase n=1 Tax=Candida tenuis (strain ATCC 10573 / BCRC 21748 / CBS 615 / JCM 9827 / NBRC 10315 / NRRL Y-1498 / VKM Y-70) TaxID=590646 RepID=G3AXH8_CANTC|nr:5-oxoprolinase [Yamadazyma tenuis ATCC 10573]EGV66384.1 5-oxoprolinase [Yamadazyma tenuis ATCC 10573]
MTVENRISISIDRGGTFTDVLAIIPGKEDYVFKLLSVDPSNYKDANIEGIRRVLEHAHGVKIPRNVPLDTSTIESIKLGTTVATNALLERKGVPTALITTEGFKDILHIGNQSRPDLFALNIVKPEALYKKVVEVEERVTLPAFTEDAKGYDAKDLLNGQTYVLGETKEVVKIIKPLNVDKTRAQLLELKQQGIVSVAVVLIHGYNYQEHEKQIGALANELGFVNVTLSHKVLPMIKAVNRGQSACVDAYLTPIVQEYIKGLISGFEEGFEKHTRVEFMMSDGGLCDYKKFTGLKSLLSGPAGGVVGQARTCFDIDDGTPTIGFDMGGTSTDVSRYAGLAFEHVFETTTAGIKLAAPQLDINTVAAGGSSILSYRNGLYQVGPESASAHPGPVCYRKNGPNLTITDANLMCGRILPEFFPKIFGETEDQPLDKEAVIKRFTEMAEVINADNPNMTPKTPYEIALGFLDVANVAMAKPIRQLTENKGFDVTKHNLASFGGAGGQHATSIARALKMKRIVIHKYSSILSAYGIALSDVVHEAQEPSLTVYNSSSKDYLLDRCTALKEKVALELAEQGISDVDYQVFFNMGYKGSDSKLMILQSDKDFLTSFYDTHQREFSFNNFKKEVIVNDIRVRGSGSVNRIQERSPFKDLAEITQVPVADGLEKILSPVYFNGGFQESKVYLLGDLPVGSQIKGPALVLDSTQTLLVDPNSVLTVLPRHVVVDLDYNSIDTNKNLSIDAVDPVQLSVFSHRFMSIAESMCTTLQKISVSANIKERLDFSCALFDECGNLVANAPSVPVHLCAMSFAVKYQINYWGSDLKPGDILATNHPKAMGTHLPDITIISPVFIEGKIRFFVGSRAHHAEIGGTVAGSMDSSATSLDSEGAKFVAWKVVQNGVFDDAGVQKYFVDDLKKIPGSSPSRKLSDNISDLKAAIAANQKGINLLSDVFNEYDTEYVLFYMRSIKDTTEAAVRSFLKKLAKQKGSKPLTAVDYMDDGARIQLKITIDEAKGSAVFDFTGTAEETFNCFNAPSSVTSSCIAYCMRCHITEGDLPLNEGMLSPIEVIIPPGTVLNPSVTAAVSGGNGITSQKIADVIMKALGTVAASYGCMNCITFGQGGYDKETGEMIPGFGFVETIGGGSGAGNGFHGFSGTQCNMTNTLMTDPEVLEQRYPVVLKQFRVREGSAGIGKWNGGEGLIRELQFTSACHASILTQRRVFRPYGMAGGGEGGRGENRLGKIRADGKTIDWKHVGPTAEIEIDIGDIIKISTPGGGGYGVANEESEPSTSVVKPSTVVTAGGSFYQYREAMNSSQ